MGLTSMGCKAFWNLGQYLLIFNQNSLCIRQGHKCIQKEWILFLK